MRNFLAVLGAILVVAILVAVLYFGCGSNPRGPLQCVRDLAIIALAIASFIMVLLFMMVAILLMRLVQTTQEKVDPILESAKRTAGTVHGTTTFVSDTLVAPLVSVSGFAAGARRTMQVLFKRKGTKKEV